MATKMRIQFFGSLETTQISEFDAWDRCFHIKDLLIKLLRRMVFLDFFISF